MSLSVKIFVALAPICMVGMVYALTRSDWWTAGMFAFFGAMAIVLYRIEKRPQ